MRFELNVQNLFNQKTATHIQNFLNRQRASAALNLASTDLTKGFDYKSMINATSDGVANAYDPRYGMDDLFNPGAQGQFSVKWILERRRDL